jgi:hypothetical protein
MDAAALVTMMRDPGAVCAGGAAGWFPTLILLLLEVRTVCAGTPMCPCAGV